MDAKYQSLKKLVDEVAIDVEKMSRNNKSAALRVRKTMLEIKTLAQEIRKEILESKKV